MFKQFVVTCFIIASVYADTKDNIKTTTQKTPELKNRFFGLENIFGQIFNGPNNQGGFGGPFQQQLPQVPFNNWQNIQNPNQGSFNGQNNFPNQNAQLPQQFPNQQPFNQQPIGQPIPQGNFNPGNNFGQNFHPGTLDGIPSQNGFNQGNPGNWQPGFQNQNQMGNQNENQFGIQNQNGNQGLQNQNGNQGFQNQDGNQGFQNQNGNQGLQNQNGNQGLQNQRPHDEEYNPAAILGKPVPVTTSVPDSIVFEDGCDTPTQRQCVQDCPSTTEYSPVCGSNNITYFNPGRFICARNCGLNVFIQRPGKCF